MSNCLIKSQISNCVKLFDNVSQILNCVEMFDKVANIEFDNVPQILNCVKNVWQCTKYQIVFLTISNCVFWQST